MMEKRRMSTDDWTKKSRVVRLCGLVFFFFKQKTAYEIGTGDWSSDVCSSDLAATKTGQYKKRGAAATKNWQYKKRGAAATRNG